MIVITMMNTAKKKMKHKRITDKTELNIDQEPEFFRAFYFMKFLFLYFYLNIVYNQEFPLHILLYA